MDTYEIRNRYYEKFPKKVERKRRVQEGRSIAIPDRILNQLKEITYLDFRDRTGLTIQTYYAILSGRECFTGTYKKVIRLLGDGETQPPCKE